MADANRPLSQDEIDALLAALSSEAEDAPQEEPAPSEPVEDEPDAAAEAVSPPEMPPARPEPRSTALLKDPRLARTSGLPVTLQVSLGGKHIAVKSLLDWGIGTQVVLNHDWQQPVTIKINGLTVGSGRVVLVGNNFGIEVTEWGRVSGPRA